jgi:hypothetical protein
MCPAALVPCPHATRGCPTITPRSSLSTHLETCPFEALAGYFTTSDARWRAVEDRFEQMNERNAQLSTEVNLLRSELRNVRGNLSVARQSLGSMWRQNVDEWYGPPVRPVERERATPGMDPENEGGQLPRTTSSLGPAPRIHTPPPLPGPGHDPSARPSESESESENDDYIPPEIEPESLSPLAPEHPNVTPRAAADMNAATGRNLFTPSFGSHQSFADWAFNRLSTTSPISAAGLDEVIAGLRSVLIHLAAGLDTMERRNEV